MSHFHHESLGEGLAITILTPLMEYADTLAETEKRSPQATLLWVLINDAKQQLEQTFDKINTVQPGISVEVEYHV